jgi:hypothetical protein
MVLLLELMSGDDPRFSVISKLCYPGSTPRLFIWVPCMVAMKLLANR